MLTGLVFFVAFVPPESPFFQPIERPISSVNIIDLVDASALEKMERDFESGWLQNSYFNSDR